MDGEKRDLHNVGLVHGGHLLPIIVFGVFECVLGDTTRSILRDQLDALHDSIDNLVLNSGILALGVLTDRNNVDVIVQCLVAVWQWEWD